MAKNLYYEWQKLRGLFGERRNPQHFRYLAENSRAQCGKAIPRGDDCRNRGGGLPTGPFIVAPAVFRCIAEKPGVCANMSAKHGFFVLAKSGSYPVEAATAREALNRVCLPDGFRESVAVIRADLIQNVPRTRFQAAMCHMDPNAAQSWAAQFRAVLGAPAIPQ